MTPLTPRFDDALRFAHDHHRLQVRKGSGVPYVSHLLQVAGLVLELGGTEDEAIGALLHDVVEDGGGAPALEAIRARFGADVARIVAANTDAWEEPKPPWRPRKEAYVAAIAGKAPDELLVSLADKLHNARAIVLDLRTVGDAVWERFREPGQVRWYYEALAAAFEERASGLAEGGRAGVGELRRTVDELARLAARRAAHPG